MVNFVTLLFQNCWVRKVCAE